LLGTVETRESVCTTARRMVAESLSCMVTVDSGAPNGLVTDRDLVVAVLCDGLEPAAPLTALRARPLVMASGSAPAGEAVRLMERAGLRDLPVTDDDGAIVGVVAAVDALALVLRELSDRVARAPEIGAEIAGRVVLVADDVKAPLPSIAGEAPARLVAERLRITEADALLVLEDGRAMGIVTQRDLLRRIVASRRDPACTSARQLMSSPLVTAAPEAPLERVVERMVEHGVRQVIVTAGRATFGMVSLPSLLTGLVLELAERLELAGGMKARVSPS